jgi:hypothetical protein
MRSRRPKWLPLAAVAAADAEAVEVAAAVVAALLALVVLLAPLALLLPARLRRRVVALVLPRRNHPLRRT